MAWRVPRASNFRDRITIERNTRTPNGGGGFTDSWQTILRAVPAHIVATRGGEQVQSLRLNGTTPVDVTVRANADTMEITAGDRAVNARTGELLNIKWVGSLQEGRKSYLTLSCMAGEVAHG